MQRYSIAAFCLRSGISNLRRYNIYNAFEYTALLNFFAVGVAAYTIVCSII